MYARWCYGSGYSSNERFYNDIQKFGWNNIEHSVIEECDETNCSERERYWILYYKSYLPEYGYNKHTNIGVRPSGTKRRFVRCIETGEIYKTLQEAGNAVGVTREAIRHAIAENKRCKGYKWEYISNPAALEFEKRKNNVLGS